MRLTEEFCIRNSCKTARLPRAVADFLVREGASAAKVIRAASEFRRDVLRGENPSVLSFLEEALDDASTAQKFSQALPIGRGNAHATPARKTAAELWDEVITDLRKV